MGDFTSLLKPVFALLCQLGTQGLREYAPLARPHSLKMAQQGRDPVRPVPKPTSHRWQVANPKAPTPTTPGCLALCVPVQCPRASDGCFRRFSTLGCSSEEGRPGPCPDGADCLGQRFSTKCDSTSEGPLATSGDILDCQDLGGGVPGTWEAKAKEAAEHGAVPRTAPLPTAEHGPAPSVGSRLRKPGLEGGGGAAANSPH